MSEYLCSRTNANIRYMKSLLISDKRRDTSRCIDHNVTPHDDASITHLHKVAVTSTIIIQEMMASNLLPIIFIHGKLRQHYRKSWSSWKILVGSGVGSGVGPLRFQIPILHSIKFWHSARSVKQEHLLSNLNTQCPTAKFCSSIGSQKRCTSTGLTVWEATSAFEDLRTEVVSRHWALADEA